jgi:hypothetical protein
VRADPAETFTFAPEVPDRVLGHMERLGAAHRGWINLMPLVREEDEPPPPVGLGALFSTAIHEVPICTWVAGTVGRKGVERDSIGVQHATGTKVVARLAGLDLPVPAGWRWVQDHPRRGLALLVPLEVSRADQLTWMLRAGTVLSKIPLTGQWEARVRQGR